jgi:hypothetical protein
LIPGQSVKIALYRCGGLFYAHNKPFTERQETSAAQQVHLSDPHA